LMKQNDEPSHARFLSRKQEVRSSTSRRKERATVIRQGRDGSRLTRIVTRIYPSGV
jgi:hypothetical protein